MMQFSRQRFFVTKTYRRTDRAVRNLDESHVSSAHRCPLTKSVQHVIHDHHGAREILQLIKGSHALRGQESLVRRTLPISP